LRNYFANLLSNNNQNAKQLYLHTVSVMITKCQRNLSTHTPAAGDAGMSLTGERPDPFTADERVPWYGRLQTSTSTPCRVHTIGKSGCGVVGGGQK
jgi:hypothetical protein